MILGFKKQFVPYVLDGSKRHTIRAGDRWRVGMRADLYEESRRPKKYDESGAQVSGMRLLFRDQVTKVEPIVIEHRANRHAYRETWANTFIRIADVELSPCSDEADLFAWHDGFRPWKDDPRNSTMSFVHMVEFWEREHGFGRRIHRFDGQVVYWDYEQRFMDVPKKAKQPLDVAQRLVRTMDVARELVG